MPCLTRFQEHLAILCACANQIGMALDSFPTSKAGEDAGLNFTLANHLHILLCNFMEEWKKLEGMGGDREIRKTLRVVSLAFGEYERGRT